MSKIKGENLYLKPDEFKFLSLAVVSLLDQIKTNANNPKVPWTPESKRTMKEITEVGNRVKLKMQKMGFDMSDLPGLADGEENEYFTKES